MRVVAYDEHSEKRAIERVKVVAWDAVDLLRLGQADICEPAAEDLHAEQRADH